MTGIRLAVMAAVYAAGAAVTAWATGVLALAGVPTVAALVLKALLVALVLVVVTRRGLQDVHVTPRVVAAVTAVSVVGFAADPFTWAARTFLGQLVLPAGVGSLVVDLVVWVTVVVVTALGVRARTRETAKGYVR